MLFFTAVLLSGSVALRWCTMSVGGTANEIHAYILYAVTLLMAFGSFGTYRLFQGNRHRWKPFAVFGLFLFLMIESVTIYPPVGDIYVGTLAFFRIPSSFSIASGTGTFTVWDYFAGGIAVAKYPFDVRNGMPWILMYVWMAAFFWMAFYAMHKKSCKEA